MTAHRRDATRRKAQAGMETLAMRQIAKMPILFDEKTILKTLPLLPGVKTAGEGATDFSVRGGNLDQNLVSYLAAPYLAPVNQEAWPRSSTGAQVLYYLFQ